MDDVVKCSHAIVFNELKIFNTNAPDYDLVVESHDDDETLYAHYVQYQKMGSGRPYSRYRFAYFMTKGLHK